MRFVGWEHERLGNLGSIAQCTASDPSQCATSALLIEVAPGVKLTWGQVVALAGDEFGSVEEMQFYAAAAGPGGIGDDETRGRLRAAMDHDLGSRPSGTVAIPPGIYNGGTKASSANETHFAELAMHNLEHFPDQGAATEAWRRHHHAAVVEAVLAGLGTAGFTLNHAYLLEAFGDHFLTDCFSAGHIRTPRTQIYRWYEQTWRPAAKTGIKFFLLGQYLQHQFVSPERMVELMKTYGPYLDLALDKLLEKLTPAVSGAVSGTIHDYEGKTGVPARRCGSAGSSPPTVTTRSPAARTRRPTRPAGPPRSSRSRPSGWHEGISTRRSEPGSKRSPRAAPTRAAMPGRRSTGPE
jgi:hypothetical protein